MAELYGLFGQPKAKNKKSSPTFQAVRKQHISNVDRSLKRVRSKKPKGRIEKLTKQAEINILTEEKRKLVKAERSSHLGIYQETKAEKMQREDLNRRRGF